VVSSTGTNIVRFAVAALLGLAACLVAWWPQSAAGSGDAVVVSSPAAALPTQKTPTVTPTPIVAPTNPAPPPAPPPAQPTPKPTKKPTHHSGGSDGGGSHTPTTLHNSGGNNTGGNNHSSGGSSNNNPPATHSATVSTSAPYVPPPAPPSTPVAPPTKHSPSAAPTTEAPTPEAQPVQAEQTTVDTGADDVETYDTYLTSSEPVQTKTAPVWVVPGILLVLTLMLALLGGVLGRGTRPAVVPVKVSDEPDEPTGS